VPTVVLGQLVFKRRNLFISPEGAGSHPHCVSPANGRRMCSCSAGTWTHSRQEARGPDRTVPKPHCVGVDAL